MKRSAEYKPLQFLAFAFVYRLFEKLKTFEPPASPTYNVSSIFCASTFSEFLICCYTNLSWCWLQEDSEDTGQALRMGKRLLRSLALVFGCIAVASLV